MTETEALTIVADLAIEYGALELDQAANARNPRASQESRPTLSGVVNEFARLADVPAARIRNRLGTLGLDLSASMEFDAGEKPASGG